MSPKREPDPNSGKEASVMGLRGASLVRQIPDKRQKAVLPTNSAAEEQLFELLELKATGLPTPA